MQEYFLRLLTHGEEQTAGGVARVSMELKAKTLEEKLGWETPSPSSV